MKPLSLYSIKYDALSEAYDRLKKDYYRLERQHETLQDNYITLATHRADKFRDALIIQMYKDVV